MSDETRAELRRFFTAMIRVAECENLTVEVIGSEPSSNPWAMVSAACQVRESKARPGSAPELPPLATDKVFALGVLLGDPTPDIERALADYMLDMGHEYATAAYERGKREAEEKHKTKSLRQLHGYMADTFHFGGLSPSRLRAELGLPEPTDADVIAADCTDDTRH